MPHEVTQAVPIGGTRLRLEFRSGERGEVDIAPLVGDFVGVFEPLTDPAFFGRVRVDPDLGTIVWPNGADLCPDVLYAAATGTPIAAAGATFKPAA